MEKHKCKLCFRNFSNGKALGGHMRSHMINLHVPPKPNKLLTSSSPSSSSIVCLGLEAELSSSPSSSSFEHNKFLNYRLTENPKRNFRLSSPEFVDTDYVNLQDRESETKPSRNPTRRRSKRPWKLGFLNQQQFSKKIKFSVESQKNESLSSVSETITEDDVAFCLMMLSRDEWKRQQEFYDEEELVDEDEESYESEEEMKSSKTTTMTMVQGRYKCETCNKVLRSYQALGGHRASHKKIKVIEQEQPKLEHHDNKKIHQCPVCFRIFASGQALGGHRRTHIIGSLDTTITATVTAIPIPSFAKFEDSLIDLNLPTPIADDEIEDSAVSDAEFVKSH
ncbi:putative transcription factor C2H2 family [Lupinus albus]|uniref:Putative transcription factor C2H2 family n=1 Tax=Lupinus albus TaxID=3870 RepID=A0A6A4QA17_LUPAL|nr:putative transcription factor C2H2 family [Lupinus albus]